MTDADSTRIESKLDDLTKTVVDLREIVTAGNARQEPLCEAHREKTDEHHRSLYGNGSPGLRADVQTIGERQTMTHRILGLVGLSCLGLVGKAIREVLKR